MPPGFGLNTTSNDWRHCGNRYSQQRIYEVLRTGCFHDSSDLVDVSDGPEDSVHLVVVSRKFDGHRMQERDDMIWSVLTTALPQEDWNKVSLLVGASPEDVKGI